MKEALLAQEDARFYVHSGIDWIGLGRAFVSIASGGAIQGGSTLTQQLVKNLITGNARAGFAGVARKVREAFIARRIERAMSKDEIIAAYLNQMDFGATDGSTAIGIVQAAQKYFGKPVKALNLYETAVLVGMLRGTTLYNPIANPDAANRQALAVLEKMLNQNRISHAEYSRALRQGISSPRARPEMRKGGEGAASIPIVTGYYVAWSRAELAEIAAAHPGRGVMRYVVGLDVWHQIQGEATIREMLARNKEGRHVGQGALVALDRDGRVDALVGGEDFASSQFDRATQAMRQPGSAFKLFVYTAAIKAGLSPNSVRLDEPVSIDGWSPDNADHKFLGPIPLKKAFALSRNTVAIRLGAEIGGDAIANIAHELGIRSPLRRRPSLALGTSEVTLLELTSAYAPFMNDGRPVRPYATMIALNSSAQVVYRHDAARLRPVANAETLQAMRGMLRAVVTEGTGRQAMLRNRWSAGKTGTTQDNRDAWFIGLTDLLTTGVWFGNDDHSPMAGVHGADMPAAAWHEFNDSIDRPRGAPRLSAPHPPPLPSPRPTVQTGWVGAWKQ
jgi:penicillin-binding protein 1A